LYMCVCAFHSCGLFIALLVWKGLYFCQK